MRKTLPVNKINFEKKMKFLPGYTEYIRLYTTSTDLEDIAYV